MTQEIWTVNEEKGLSLVGINNTSSKAICLVAVTRRLAAVSGMFVQTADAKTWTSIIQKLTLNWLEEACSRDNDPPDRWLYSPLQPHNTHAGLMPS